MAIIIKIAFVASVICWIVGCSYAAIIGAESDLENETRNPL